MWPWEVACHRSGQVLMLRDASGEGRSGGPGEPVGGIVAKPVPTA